MLFVEHTLREECKNLKAVIGASATFGGEEIVALE
jgi:hypothetical protein